MPPINVITAFIMCGGLVFVLFAFIPFIRRDSIGNVAFFLIRGAMVAAIISIVRSGYWDFGPYLTGDYWQDIRTFFGGPKATSAFNIAMFFPVRDFLTARWYLIDESERMHWYWWTSWMHPKWRVRRLRDRR